ncbi:MAG: hypothetical protein V4498_05505, partial [candidate division FCPU426 bacterium]
ATPALLRIFLGDKADFQDPQGTACARMAENGPENPQLTIFGVDAGLGWVVYNPDMLSLSTLGEPGSEEGQFLHPTGVAALADGRVAVADTGNHRVALLRFKNKKLFWEGTLGKQGTGPGEFDGPTWLAFDSQGRLYVSDTGNNRVQVFSAELQPLFQFGADQEADNSLEAPLGIAVVDPGQPWMETAESAIYVADHKRSRIQKFDLQGRFLEAASGADTGLEGVAFSGLALDTRANLWAADRANHRIHKFDRFLQYLDSWGGKGKGDGKLESPRGLSIYPHYGQVFVAEKSSAQYMWIGADLREIRVAKAPVKDGQERLRVEYTLTENGQLECWVVKDDKPKKKLARLLEKTGIQQGRHSLYWDKLDENGSALEPGDYSVVFQAEANYSSATFFKREKRKKFTLE